MARPKKTIRALDKVISVRIDQGRPHPLAGAGVRVRYDDWRVGAHYDPGQPERVARHRAGPHLLPRIRSCWPRWAGCGNNLNQLARAANRHELPDQRELLARLIDHRP